MAAVVTEGTLHDPTGKNIRAFVRYRVEQQEKEISITILDYEGKPVHEVCFEFYAGELKQLEFHGEDDEPAFSKIIDV